MADRSPPSEPSGADAAEAAKLRLRADLRLAMRARDALETAVLRAVIAALDNAQAVPAGDAHQTYVERPFGDASAEVPRLILGTKAVEALLEAEAADRLEAADQCERLARPERATQLRAEAAIVARYLADPKG